MHHMNESSDHYVIHNMTLVLDYQELILNIQCYVGKRNVYEA